MSTLFRTATSADVRGVDSAMRPPVAPIGGTRLSTWSCTGTVPTVAPVGALVGAALLTSPKMRIV